MVGACKLDGACNPHIFDGSRKRSCAHAYVGKRALHC